MSNRPGGFGNLDLYVATRTKLTGQRNARRVVASLRELAESEGKV